MRSSVRQKRGDVSRVHEVVALDVTRTVGELGLGACGFGGSHPVFGEMAERGTHHLVEGCGLPRLVAIVVAGAAQRLARECAGDR